MALKLPNIKFSGFDAKSRIFLLFAGVVGISLLVYLVVRFFGGGEPTTGAARVAGAPGGLVSVPGSEVTQQYRRAIELASEQRAQMGMQARGAAVPTLVNVSREQGDCTVMCPGDEAANVADDIARLISQGKITQQDADMLLDLAAKKVSVDEYAAALDALVKSGKLTPEQARLLLEKYKKQHANVALSASAQAMDAMIKTGELPLSVANELLELQKRKLTPEDYAAELDRLVKEGKLSPEAAAKLLAQYTQQGAAECAKYRLLMLNTMASSGEITSDVAKKLTELQNKTIPLNQYSAELDKLVADKKMTPAAGAKLFEDYRKPCATGNTIFNKLLAKGGASAAFANQLMELQGNNVSLKDYADTLKKAVEAGLVTPEEATSLYQLYQAKLAAPATGVAPTADTTVPAFAELQKRIKDQAPATAPEFKAPTAGAAGPITTGPTAEELKAQAMMSQEKQKQMEVMMAAMSGQAQSLIAAWQPAVMVHRDGVPPEKPKSGSGNGLDGEGTAAEKAAAKKGPAMIKAGSIFFAVLDTAVDSDYPDTPVMATIIEGKFKGAKLLGKLSLAPNGQKVSLNFNLMDMEGWDSAKTVSAFAIDPDSAKTVMASEVDNHYLSRYGYTMATAFLQGYSTAITNEGTTFTGSIGTTTSTPALSPTNKIAVGLGQIGTSLASDAAKKIDRPPTVKVTSGVGLGILFAAEVAG